ncbi:sensor histidine kinase [Virgisporangium aliadipatigenens]|uniref:Sensor histidine kinase n=1 Tax=Virgisporangium aliadipatigenens TaxID=741659 RepID=A0A8J3YQY7_9ACTN|nr:GAF domain-containing sensor histidine kinase [Virgisporangium aliadipatigenens]GIJ48723.1 sensor histidine kinase [Virgisporangium aliadipatigenens]
MRAPIPSTELERLSALRELDLLPERAEPDLDDIADLAAGICGTPVSLVTLIEMDRADVLARGGADAPEAEPPHGTDTGSAAVPRDESFCAHAILGRGLLVVPDARSDRRFAENPHVMNDPGIRFYAGAPLVTTNGHALGALCVVDAVPRRLAIGQLRALRALASQITAQLELRRYAKGAAGEAARRHELDRVHDDLGVLVGSRLREPLAELRRCAEVLRDVEFCPPDVAARVGAAVHAQAPDLVRLLDDLLTIAGPPGSVPDLQRQEVDLVTLTEWAVREVRPIADAKDIMLSIDAGTPAPMSADPRRLAQALAHLLFNAVKFTPRGGKVRVRVHGDGAPTMELQDTGAGGEPAKLYEHVYRGAISPAAGDPAEAPDAGLAAVKAILDAHHASVALCDGSSAGTALHLVFPRR